jgi:hypothetical protein
MALLLGLFIFIRPGLTQSIEATPGGGATWQAGVNGVEIEFHPDGRVSRIYSKYAHPVTIPDRRGIRTATVIAEEKAKGEIIRFMQQQVATGRVVAEVEATLSKTAQQKGTGADGISSLDQRTVTQSLTELSSSTAAGTLKGVVVLESGYDDKSQEAWVAVGVSDKTISAASATKEMLTAPRPSHTQAEPKAGVGQGQPSVPSEVRRGNRDF